MTGVKSISFVDGEYLDGDVYRDVCQASQAGGPHVNLLDAGQQGAADAFVTAHPLLSYPATDFALNNPQTSSNTYGNPWFQEDDAFNHEPWRFKIKKATQIRFWDATGGTGNLLAFVPSYDDIAYCGPVKPVMVT